MFPLSRPLLQSTSLPQGSHPIISHTISQYSITRQWQERVSFFVENFDNCCNITSVNFTHKNVGLFSPFEIIIVFLDILVSTSDEIRYRYWPRVCRTVGFPKVSNMIMPFKHTFGVLQCINSTRTDSPASVQWGPQISHNKLKHSRYFGAQF